MDERYLDTSSIIRIELTQLIKMAPADGALILAITQVVETKDDIKRAVNEMADMGIDQVG